MIRSLDDKIPRIADSAFVSEAAYIVGDVEIGENSSVWPGAVIRGDFGSITIGDNVAVEDGAIIHVGSPAKATADLYIGNNVHIGHGAVINCLSIGDSVLVGMNATILHDARIGSHCIIAAGCLIPEGMDVPNRSVVTGIPGKIKGQVTEKQLWWVTEGTRLYVDLARQYKRAGL